MQDQYIGNELGLFDKAINWKGYYGSLIKPYLKGTVMEVGAGIGATAVSLINDSVEKWICLEPDSRLAEKIVEKQALGLLPNSELRIGTLNTQPPDERYDSIIYIDVIEHIENDAAELQLAATRLKPGGHLVILVPAHNFLFSEFDKAIGHYRRYDRKMLKEAVPSPLKQIRLSYLDCIGMAASAANRFLMKKSYPTQKQVMFWDRKMVPLSKYLDPLLGYGVGKSVLGIWQKN